MAEPGGMILPLLREMRAENASLHAQTGQRLERMDRRGKRIGGQFESFRHALTGDTLMGKLVTGEFEERIEEPERTVKRLEAHT